MHLPIFRVVVPVAHHRHANWQIPVQRGGVDPAGGDGDGDAGGCCWLLLLILVLSTVMIRCRPRDFKAQAK